MSNSRLRWEMLTKGNDCEEIICKYTDLENHYRVTVVYNRDKKTAEYFVRPIVSYGEEDNTYVVDVILKYAMFTNVASLEEVLIHMTDRINSAVSKHTRKYTREEGIKDIAITDWRNYRLRFTITRSITLEEVSIVVCEENSQSRSEIAELHMHTIKDGMVKSFLYFSGNDVPTECSIKVVKL